jgi:hypothetical protein
LVERMGGPTTLPWHDPQPGALTLWGMLLGFTAVATAGGWVASRLEDRAPAVAVLTGTTLGGMRRIATRRLPQART